VDLLEIARVRRELARQGARFGRSAFTAAEASVCERTADPALRYAEFFAAKEAAWKSVGASPPHTGGWLEAEVRVQPGGMPTLALRGGLLQAARRRGAAAMSLTFSHTRDHALACVVAATSGA
jgi:holo-[acyl-carrier protein] synthase